MFCDVLMLATLYEVGEVSLSLQAWHEWFSCKSRDLLMRKLKYREFKKLRRQLQRKCHIKIELCVKLSLVRLFQIDHVVQNRRSALSLAGHRWFSCKGKE